MPTLEEQIQTLITQTAPATLPGLPTVPGLQTPPFAENQNEFGMPNIGSFMKVQNGNLGAIAIGVMAATTIGGMISRVLPSVGNFGPVIAGALILMFLGTRGGIIRDIGSGVLIGGLAMLLKNYTGGMFGMPGSNDMMAEEQKATYGGGDGVYPTQPDRRTFA